MKKIAIWLLTSLMLLMMACNSGVETSNHPTATPDEKVIFISATATPTTKPTVEPTATMTNEPTPDVEEPEITESANPTDSPTPTPEPTKKPPAATPKPTKKPTPVPTATPKPTSEPTLEPTNEPTPEPTPDPEDDGPQLPIVPLSELVVSDEFAKTYGGLYIYRDDKLYTTSSIPIETALKYNVGRVNTEFKNIANLAGLCETDGYQHYYLSIGEQAPMMRVTEGDELRVYGGSTAEFREIDYYGHTVNSYRSDDKMILYKNPQDSHELILSDVTHIELRDTENLSVDDPLWLDFGADYKMLWEDSSGSHELELKGDCRCYNYDEHSRNIATILGTLSEDGEFYTVTTPELLSGVLYVYAGGQMSIIAYDEE